MTTPQDAPTGPVLPKWVDALREQARTKAHTKRSIGLPARDIVALFEVFDALLSQARTDGERWERLYREETAETQAAEYRAERLSHQVDDLKMTKEHLEGCVEVAEQKVHAVEAVHVWTNEDGKQFMFADDVRAALGIPA